MPVFSIGRVFGDSMTSRVPSNSFVIAVKLPQFYPKQKGQMFFIEHPCYGKIVKTLDVIQSDGTLWFRGESFSSVSSEAMGPIRHKQIIGRVVWVISP